MEEKRKNDDFSLDAFVAEAKREAQYGKSEQARMNTERELGRIGIYQTGTPGTGWVCVGRIEVQIVIGKKSATWYARQTDYPDNRWSNHFSLKLGLLRVINADVSRTAFIEAVETVKRFWKNENGLHIDYSGDAP